MPVSVVVGGQFGSEGKGKVAHFLAASLKAAIAVRVGGPNSGHTVVDAAGRRTILRHLPTAALLPDTRCVIPPGAYIEADLLLREIEMVGLTPDRLAIDDKAFLIADSDREAERVSGLRGAIGSTGSGTGAAVQRRIARVPSGGVTDDPRLHPFVTSTQAVLRASLTRHERIIIEGTQGFGLSLLHAPSYPFVTSRDTTAAAFLAESGLSPLDVDSVVVVLRALPIRVGGNSGPMTDEIDWATVQEESGYSDPVIEYTSVTNSIRRIARFDATIPRLAIAANAPTTIVMNHVDYIDAACRRERRITPKAAQFLDRIESAIGRRIDLVGVAPDLIVQRDEQQAEHPAARVG